MHIGIYNTAEKKVDYFEEIDEKRVKTNSSGEDGKAEAARAIERMTAATLERNPQYIDEATGKAFDQGPWFVYADERPFDWDIVAHEPTDLEKASAIRAQRNGLLDSCDKTQVADSPLPTADKAAWKAYRQALRDITKQPTFPESIEWPEAPSA